MTRPTDAMELEETLARWRAEEAAVRARVQRAPGVASPDRIAGRSVLQITLPEVATSSQMQPESFLTLRPGLSSGEGRSRKERAAQRKPVGSMLSVPAVRQRNLRPSNSGRPSPHCFELVEAKLDTVRVRLPAGRCI